MRHLLLVSCVPLPVTTLAIGIDVLSAK